MDNKEIQQQLYKQEQQLYQQHKSNKRFFALIIMLLFVVVLSVGYAVLSTNFNIQGTTVLAGWDVGFGDNPISCTNQNNGPNFQCHTVDTQEEFNNAEPDEENAYFWISGDTVYFKHYLKQPGATFSFNATYANDGVVNAKIGSFSLPTLTTLQSEYLSYSMTYSDNSTINNNDLLNAGQSRVFKVTVTYKDTAATSPTAEEINTIKSTPAIFNVNYIQA